VAVKPVADSIISETHIGLPWGRPMTLHIW
jgi:hypothetical protein